MTANKPPMLTVVSHSFPPRVSATALVLTNLFSTFPGQISAIAGHNRSATYDSTFSAPCETEYLSLPCRFPKAYDRLKRRAPALAEGLVRKTVQNALAKFNTQVVLGVFPFDDLFVASFLAAKRLQLPFYGYIQDLWTETMPRGSSRRRFAEKWEPIIFSEAKRIICMTEAAQQHYENKYGIKTFLLPHGIPSGNLSQAPSGLLAPTMENPTVCFVGGVNQKFNLDALKTLDKASEFLPPKYNLVFSTPGSKSRLRDLGISSPRLDVQYIPRSFVQNFMSQSHVLVAPLSHKNCSMEEVRTLFSTKLLDYFLSGRPIVVFAPEDSYHAVSAKQLGWGHVVSRDCPRALAEGIVQVVQNQPLAEKLVRAALQEAQRRNADFYAARLATWITEDVPPSRSKM